MCSLHSQSDGCICYGKLEFENCADIPLQCFQLSMPFPGDQLVYDFKLDDGGVSSVERTGDELDEEERKKSATKVTHFCCLLS